MPNEGKWVGHMVGSGIYVLTGSVTRNIAGPAIVVSFLIAGCISFLSALCFAEFGSRVPRAGSTYVFTYITMGEFWAFLVGWNVVLDHLIGGAAVARAWSGYVDSLSHGAIHNATAGGLSGGGSNHSEWAQQLDFLAAGIVMVFALLQAINVRASTNINSLFSLVNVGVMLFVSLYGLSFANLSNWSDFTPYGASGVLAGASSCFYAFVGLDSMAIAAEEAKDPGYSVPRATFYAMGIVTVGYVMVSLALSLMIPYNMVSVNAALPHAFIYNGVEWAQYLVSVAALAGMSSVLYGYLYTLPRYVYTMASDGLVFRMFSRVSSRTQVPVLNTFVLGAISALLALTTDISKLVEFLSMGTLVGYSMVAMSVLLMRYRPTLLNADGTETTDCIGGELKESFHFLDPFISRLPYATVPTAAIYTFTVASFLLSSVIVNTENKTNIVTIIVMVFFATLLVSCVAAMLAFEQTEPRSFAVPFCPVVPLISIGFNMVLLSYLSPQTWVRFVVWMTAGLLIYFCYGIRHSNAEESWRRRPLTDQERAPQWYGSAPPGSGQVRSAGRGPETDAQRRAGDGEPTRPDTRRKDSDPTISSEPRRPPLESELTIERESFHPPAEMGDYRLPRERNNRRGDRYRDPYQPATESEPHQPSRDPRAQSPALFETDESLQFSEDFELPRTPSSRRRRGPSPPPESDSETELPQESRDSRPGLRRQEADAESLPSLTHEQTYRTTY